MKTTSFLQHPLVQFWIIIAFCVTALFGTVYVAGQQSYRQNANDPQIQISETSAMALAAGRQPALALDVVQIPIDKDLSPFSMIFDKNGKLTSASARLDNKVPQVPKGAITAAKGGQNRVTWQPKDGVRIAAVITHYKQDNREGYVLIGRNLREVERRESKLLQMVFGAWLVTLAGSALLLYFWEQFNASQKQTRSK